MEFMQKGPTKSLRIVGNKVFLILEKSHGTMGEDRYNKIKEFLTDQKYHQSDRTKIIKMAIIKTNSKDKGTVKLQLSQLTVSKVTIRKEGHKKCRRIKKKYGTKIKGKG